MKENKKNNLKVTTKFDNTSNVIEFGNEALMVLVIRKKSDGTIAIFGNTDIVSGKLMVKSQYTNFVEANHSIPLGGSLTSVKSGLSAIGGRAIIKRALNEKDVGNKVQELFDELSESPMTIGVIANEQ
jgi:hypothetical protein